MKEKLRALGLLLSAKTLLLESPRLLLLEDLVSGLIGVLSCIGLVGFARGKAWGAGVLATAFAVRIGCTFPHTLNHAWFEFLAALILWRAFAARDERTFTQAGSVLKVGLLSVFLYSGVQKLAHGQFVSGEYLLRTIAFESSHMADTLRAGLGRLMELPRADMSLLALHPTPLDVCLRLRFALAALSVGIVVAEILVPILVVLRVRGARWVLLAMQVGIGLCSGEFDFALTVTGVVLLFWDHVSRSAWIGAFVGWGSLTVATVLLGSS